MHPLVTDFPAWDPTDIASLLVVFGHQPVQQAHAEAGAPAAVDLALRRAHGSAGDVEMRPWRLVDETLQQLRRRNGAAMAPTGILHVCDFRIAYLVVFRPARHSP